MLIDDLEFMEATSSEIQGGRRRFRYPRLRARSRFKPYAFESPRWGGGENRHPLIHIDLDINIQIINVIQVANSIAVGSEVANASASNIVNILTNPY